MTAVKTNVFAIVMLAGLFILFREQCTAEDFPDNTVQVVVSIDQKITLEGKPVKSAELAAKLKSIGAKPDTIIRVLVQKNTSEAIIKDISRALANGGYRKFLFTQPKQAEVTVKEPSRK